MFLTVGGGVLWLYYREERYSTTADEVNGGPRVAAVAEFHGCEEFLGLCGFYQRFVADYATVATPLTNLIGNWYLLLKIVFQLSLPF